MNEHRIRLYEQLLQAQEKIAQRLYARGVSDETVLAAMDAAEALSEADQREDLYLSSLSAYVRALGGHVEVRAVFPEEEILVRRDPA